MNKKEKRVNTYRVKVGGSILRRIGIYFFCVVAIGCITSGILYRKNEKADEIRLEKAIQNEATENTQNTNQVLVETIEVSDSSICHGRFFVIEEDGYLVIYDKSSMKRYDETTILVENLPEKLRLKVQEGIYFMNEEELYAFLESYSS